MKSLFARFRTASGKSRYTWAPATEITDGWMVCALNPYGTAS